MNFSSETREVQLEGFSNTIQKILNKNLNLKPINSINVNQFPPTVPIAVKVAINSQLYDINDRTPRYVDHVRGMIEHNIYNIECAMARLNSHIDLVNEELLPYCSYLDELFKLKKDVFEGQYNLFNLYNNVHNYNRYTNPKNISNNKVTTFSLDRSVSYINRIADCEAQIEKIIPQLVILQKRLLTKEAVIKSFINFL